MIQMTLQVAEVAVRAAQDKAKALGSPMTVTVVDEAGRLVLSARGDGTGFFTPETSRAKAVASAAFKRSNKELAEMVAARHEGVTPAQVALAWVLRQDGVCAIPKATRPAHVRENRAALDIRLTSQEASSSAISRATSDGLLLIDQPSSRCQCTSR